MNKQFSFIQKKNLSPMTLAIAMGSRDLGLAFQKMNCHEEAIHTYEKALRISDEVGLTHKTSEIKAALADLKLAGDQDR